MFTCRKPIDPVEALDGKVSIRVPRDQAAATAARLLAQLPVVDLTVTDPPLEAVMDELYRAGAGPSPFDAGQLGALRQLAESGAGTSVAAIFFCVGSTVFFYLLSRSAYIPRLLSLLGLYSSLVYLAYWSFGLVVPDYPGAVTIAASLPILVAEVSAGLWLLTRGIKTPATAV